MTEVDFPNEFELSNPPSDGISSVRFGPTHANFLLASSWDTSVRLYDVPNKILRATFHHSSAALDICFTDNTHGASAGLDKAVKYYDFNAHSERVLGYHGEGIRCIDYFGAGQLIVTGSWDQTVKLWDVRSPQPCVATSQQPGKVFSISAADEKLIVGTAGRHVYVWDMRNMDRELQQRESSLKFQTRCIRSSPDAQGYVLSSIEGRVAVEFLDPSPEIQKRKYAFKCHRKADANGVQTIYPVNSIAFHPIHGTFATGGSDGIVNVWDAVNKKRLCQFHQYPASIASLSFSADGSMLAIASSYTFEEGEKDHAPDSIIIRMVTPAETKSTARAV
eukprot:Opistho-2@68450